jgi:DNA modification methylase
LPVRGNNGLYPLTGSLLMHDVIHGDSLTVLRTLPDESVQCCVTSPPYFGLRSYLPEGHEDKHLEQGLEESPDEYVSRMVEVFREVRRVLREDGTCWVNMGDSYNNAGSSKNGTGLDGKQRGGATGADGECGYKKRDLRHALKGSGIKHKDLVGIPWRVAFALQADGWWLRQDVIWHKPNPMPESVRDRCTKSHEYVFLLTKSERYYYDADAIATLSESGAAANLRSVWTLSTRPYKGAHFATMPETLAETCILAGTSEHGCCPDCGSPWKRVTERKKLFRDRPNNYVKRNGEAGTGNSCGNTVAGVSVTTLGWEPTCKCGNPRAVPCTVLDPFAGSGTTLAVAASLGLDGIGIELNADYIELAKKRIVESVSLFA